MPRFWRTLPVALFLLIAPIAAQAQEDRPPKDDVKFSGLDAEAAAKAVTLPEGFKATVFAKEPDIVQPIAFTIDARGRLWVVEGLTYPIRERGDKGKDRIVIFEDTDGDGTHDKRTIFMENLNLVSGIEVGFGGVWIGAAPYFMFIPDKNGDDKPDGKPEILLDGWGFQDTHETLNTFTWGPDGWLYGCHGVFTHSRVGKPGTPKNERIPLTAGYWRYHPTKHIFEVFAEGTSNPWGIDFDDRGQLFAEACVIPHFWHIVQGARYQRQSGPHENRYTYDDIKQSGDHVHYAGADGPHAGNNRSDSAGGGHAHCGLMVYLGDNWPDQFRDKIFIGNIHGQRINMDIAKPKGSGFVGTHGPDFMNFNDRWSQVINFRYGPDGAVYFIDWYDANQCHNRDPNRHDQSNGRIYKVWYGDLAKKTGVDVEKLSDAELVKLQLHKNDWYVRNARRVLQERAAAGKDLSAAHKDLADIARKNSDVSRKLRAMWALHATDGFEEKLGLALLADSNDPYAKAWSIQLLTESGKPGPAVLKRFAQLAKKDSSQVVRLYLASAVQRLEHAHRWDILAGLLSHEKQDANDHNLPLMYWYAIEPLAASEPTRALELVSKSNIPDLRTFAARRITEGATADAK